MNTCHNPQNPSAAQQPVDVETTAFTLTQRSVEQQAAYFAKVIDQSAVALINDYDAIVNTNFRDTGFFAQQVKAKFGRNITTLRTALYGMVTLAADADKAGTQ